MKIRWRRGTSAQWAAANPVLASAEPSMDLTTGTIKVGDGTTVWSALGSLLGSATGLRVQEGGAAARMGSAALVAGTVTVPTTAVGASTRIFLTHQAPNGGTPGFLGVSARVNGTSFTILSSNVADTSTVAWLLIEPA